MDLIGRLYSRPPMSWTLALWNWLTTPLRRRRERRQAALAAEYQALAATLRAVGVNDAARVLQKRADVLAAASGQDAAAKPPTLA